MIKKIVLSASMALVAIAFAAPAAAQAEAFWTQGEGEGTLGEEGEGTNIHVEGEIISAFSLLYSITTKWPLTLRGEVFNGPEMGEGTITEMEAGTGTIIGLPGILDCTIEEVTLLGGPWSLTLAPDDGEEADTEDVTLTLEDAKFLTHLSIGCQVGGISKVLGSTGDLTITASTHGGHTELTIEKSHMSMFYPTVEGTPHVSPPAVFTYSTDPNPLTLTSEEGGIGVEQH